MKFFAALKNAEFAAKAFAEAGLDLEKLAAAGDVNAIKASIEAVKPTVDVAKIEADAAVVKQENAALNEALASAKAENDELNTKLKEADAKVKDVEAKSKDLDAKASLKAREMLAKAGVGEPILNAPSADAAKPGKPSSKKTLTYAEFSALSPTDKMDFSKNGGRIADL